MDLLQKVSNIQKNHTRMLTLYSIIGKFGDRLSKDVQEELRIEAEDLEKEIEKQKERLL